MRIPGTPQAGLASPRVGVQAPGAAGFFAGLGQAADQVAAGAQRLMEARDHTYLVDAQNAYTAGMDAYSLEQEEGRSGAAAAGYTKDYEAEHKRLAGDIAAGMGQAGLSQRGQAAFNAWAAGRENVGKKRAALFEHAQMQAHAKDTHNVRVQGVMTRLGQDPMSWPDAFGQLAEAYALAVGQGLYRPEEAQAAHAAQKEKAKVTAFDNLYAVDRELAMGSMDALELGEEQKAKARKRFLADGRADQAALRAQNQEQLAGLKMQVDAAEYIAKQTGEVGELVVLASAFEILGEAQMGTKLRERAALYENNALAIKESQAMTLPELAEAIQELGGRLPGMLEGDAQEAAARHKRGAEEMKLRLDIYQARLKAMRDDPAGAVAEQAEKGLPPGAERNPRAISDMRLAAQEINGVPPALRKVLTKAEAAALQAEWQGGDLSARLNIAAGLGAYGPHAGNVAAELGLSPTEQLVIAQVGHNPGAVNALNTIITAGSLKGEELPKLERADSLAREAADDSEVLRGYRAAARAMPGIAALQLAVRDLENNMGKLVRMKGGDVDSARKTIDGSLLALADGNFALVYDPARYDEDALEETLRRRQAGAALEALADSRSNFKDEADRAEWLAHMRRSGIWLNAPDGDGFILFDPVAQAPAMGARGELLRVRDDEVSRIELAEDSPAGPGWDDISGGDE